VALFYFSGHGSQIRDRDGDELTDFLDELICPYDMDWDSRTYILDDDLDEILRSVAPGALVEAFFDCCFWGAGARDLAPEPAPERLRADVRYLAPPIDIFARAEGELPELAVHRLSESVGPGNVFWAASQEGQPATEDYLEGRANGVFTYWGCRFIAERLGEGGWGYTRAQLLQDLREYLQSLGYGQRPELAAPDALRDATPLMPLGWGSWVEIGGPGY
jgi:hypothetical protein